MPYCQVCLVTVKLFVSVSVNEACANYQYQIIGKKNYRSGTNYLLYSFIELDRMEQRLIDALIDLFIH